MSWQLRSVLLVAWASATCALPAGTKLKAPRNWRTTFDLLSELRADRTAVVDQMGTEAITKAATAEDAPVHALVSLMLSSQTKDTVNLATMKKLRAHGLTLENILQTPDEPLAARESRPACISFGQMRRYTVFADGERAALRAPHDPQHRSSSRLCCARRWAWRAWARAMG